MKITNKITVLVLLALSVLAFNSLVALFYLDRVQQELSSVASKDIALMRSLGALAQQQLEQKVLFEKLKAVGEELSSGQVNDARKAYLQEYVTGLSGVRASTERRTNETIVRSRGLLGVNAGSLDPIAQGYAEYQSLIVEMMQGVSKGDFQLSFEHLEDFSTKESRLARQLTGLLKEIEGWVDQSVARSQRLKQRTQNLLAGIFVLSLLVCGFWAWRIAASIRKPLDALTQAALTIGEGKFDIHLRTDSQDEIAAVAQAFNAMGGQVKEFKEKLEEQNKALASTNRELDRFVHTASHDIIGPLTAIVGYGAFLEQHYVSLLDDKGRECVSGVRKGAGRLSRLIKDLLELTRVTRVKNPYTQTAVDEVVAEALAHCDFAITQNHTRVLIDGELPNIVCDRIKLTTVFTNLIGNAVKYSSKKHPQGAQVKIGYSPGLKHHEFYVQDNGIGIPAEHHQGIFDLFSRLHTSEEYEGVGAGLAIVKAAVEDQGGTIRVASMPGVSTTFIFTIPKDLPAYSPIV